MQVEAPSPRRRTSPAATPTLSRRSRVIARALLLAAVLALVAAAPVTAAPVIGIGEQKPAMFSDPLYTQLSLRHARYIAPWDALKDERQRDKLDAWMEAARAANTRVLIGFERSLRSRKLSRTLPTDAQFAREFKRFRARYPDVRDWIVWNEANHPFSLTANRPRRAARYFGIVARNCRGCNVVAADVLDVTGMTSWVKRFQRYATETPRIWGIHNYGDTNRLKSTGTQALLDVTRGQLWFTETGGLVVRREYAGTTVTREFRYTQRHAARSTRHVFELACLSRRIRRVYLYHWQAPPSVTNWDSGLLGSRGAPRPAYHTLRRQLTGGWDRCRG
jgi:hypothetical protein